ncbi:vegetative cell wall protein gp1-like [Piliocolobus tephrosceles]|uniref:vegetative cell wall protein gp1-like n=1 Tax=Piliocolobus tephrosceles TaxID=591936 RepID=UPI00130119A4|nr:vegetative cell wall protein gp1-like [Piliocolobus tephrosceles]
MLQGLREGTNTGKECAPGLQPGTEDLGKPGLGRRASGAPAPRALSQSHRRAPSRGCGKASRSAQLTRLPEPPAHPRCPGQLRAPRPPAPAPQPLRSAPPGGQSSESSLEGRSPRVGENRVLPARQLQPAPRASSQAWVCPRAGSSPADTRRLRFCRDPRRPPNRSLSEPAPPPGPPTPRPHLGRRPATHLSAVQPETLPSSPVPGSGVSAQTREKATRLLRSPPQRAADSSRTGRRSRGRGWPLADRRGRSRAAHWPRLALVPSPGSAGGRHQHAASSEYFAQNFSARAARRLARGAAQGRERRGGACEARGRGPEGAGGR